MFGQPLDRAERADLAHAMRRGWSVFEIVAASALAIACASFGLSVGVLLHIAGVF